MRDSNANPIEAQLGNTMPDYRVSMSQDLRIKRLSLHGLLDVSVGNDLFNEERQFSLLSYMNREMDQDGKSVETAKPIGYYWRAGRPINLLGVGGFYDFGVIENNRSVEDASYAKLREVSLGFELAGLRHLCNCTVSVVGRNLYTWSRFQGWDPEVGLVGGQSSSGALAASASFQYPPMRTFTFAVSARF